MNHRLSTSVLPLVAFGLCFSSVALAAPRELKGYNGASFAAACSKSPVCYGDNRGGTVMGNGKDFNVTCSEHSCVYTETPVPPPQGGGKGGGGGSPARTAAPDKTLGTGVGLQGILMGQTPAQPRKLNVGQRIDVPKVDTPKPVKVDVPRAAVPAMGKDVQVNTIK